MNFEHKRKREKQRVKAYTSVVMKKRQVLSEKMCNDFKT